MADARPTFPLSQRYTPRKQKQFSRPMTGHTPQKLPSFDAISCIIAVHAQNVPTRARLCYHMYPCLSSIISQNFTFFQNIHTAAAQIPVMPQLLIRQFSSPLFHRQKTGNQRRCSFPATPSAIYFLASTTAVAAGLLLRPRTGRRRSIAAIAISTSA